MNILDILILISLAWGLYKGFTKGLIIELASVVAVILAVWGAVTFSDKVAHYLKGTFGWQLAHLSLLAFVITFILIIVLVILLAKLLTGLVDATGLGILNKLFGALLGAFKFALLLGVLFFILEAANEKMHIISRAAKNESKLYKPLLAIATKLIPALKNSTIGDLVDRQN